MITADVRRQVAVSPKKRKDLFGFGQLSVFQKKRPQLAEFYTALFVIKCQCLKLTHPAYRLVISRAKNASKRS